MSAERETDPAPVDLKRGTYVSSGRMWGNLLPSI